ncbi:sugar-phosphatase [Clostridium tarantellae]|uniref:Sugar-phosphatase n=1 Tax=Clostridium tarantellae TaxID=39493 RepID=A0A6I1MLP7_9CLOT|nr:sugar-phosphatase [Clostridium tarantellae]MPQ44416.1 sugar-phosphatase [Clostridium tarantellae]
MYKLIAIDMDGTLLRADKTISDKTKKALKEAKEHGVHVVLATGRPVDGVTRYLEELNLTTDHDYVLSFNGAIVRNVGTREIICRDVLKGSDLHKLYNISKDLGVNIHAFSTKGLITPIMSKYTEVEATINNIKVDIVDFNTITNEEDIIKVMMIDEPEVLDAAIKKLPKELYEKYTVVKSTPYFLEFLSKTSNKGEGVRELIEHLGIKREEVIAIGDAGNDAHMIEYAGLGVAMGNAFEDIKEMADFVTKSNEEDGVAYVVEKFILNN